MRGIDARNIWAWVESNGLEAIEVGFAFYLVNGIATYFSDTGHPVNILQQVFSVGTIVAVALCLLAYFMARRTAYFFQTALHQRKILAVNLATDALTGQQIASAEGAARARAELANAWTQFRVHVAILSVLLSFDIWNQAQYLIETWHPSQNGLSGPFALQITIRAVIIPAVFMCIAFLTKRAPSFVERMQEQANRYAARVMELAMWQWDMAIKLMKRKNYDVTPLAITLVEDPTMKRYLEDVHKYVAHFFMPIPQITQVAPQTDVGDQYPAQVIQQNALPAQLPAALAFSPVSNWSAAPIQRDSAHPAPSDPTQDDLARIRLFTEDPPVETSKPKRTRSAKPKEI